MLKKNYLAELQVAAITMKKVRNLHFTRALTGATALVVLAGILLSTTLALVNSRPVSAQAAGQDYSFTWRNAGTIVSGNKIYYDPAPNDSNKTYANPGAGRCKFGALDIPNDRIYADSPTRGRHFTVDQTKKNGLGKVTCEETNYPVTASNPEYAKVMLYREGDNLIRYDGTTQFTKKSTGDVDGTKNAEIFLRNGESSAACPDVVVHGDNGRYNGWFLYMMSPPEGEYVDSAIGESNEYIKLNVRPDATRCWGAPREAERVLRLVSLVVNPNWSAGGELNTDSRNDAFTPAGWPAARKFAMGVPDASQAGPPPGAEPPISADGNADQGPATGCDISFNFATALGFKWIICPFVNILMSTISWLEDFLTTQLITDTAPLESSHPYHTVWASFRTLALGIIIVVALVMVIFEATGVEAFSAYTVRTLFTRFGVAVLFIVLSWAILGEVVSVVNLITEGARTIIYSPFSNLPDGDLGGGASFMLLILGTGGILALGPWALLSFVVTAAMAIFVTVVVLVLVHAIIYILIMVSPVAIALSVLPNTRKGYELWKNGLASMFIGLVAVAFAMPALDVIAQSTYALEDASTLNQIIALILKLMRVFVVLFIFSRVGGMLGTITGMVNDRSRGAFDRLKKFRSNSMQQRHQERMEGSSKVFGSEKLAGAYRRAGSVREGGLSVMQRGRSRYESAEQKRQSALRAKRLEDDHGRAAGNDEANEIAQRNGMNRSKFVDAYTSEHGKTTKQAEKALAELEAGYGAQIGTRAMQATAWQAYAASNTSYNHDPADPDKANRDMMTDAARHVVNGSMTEADATAAMKSNRARVDRAGMSFGTTIGTLSEVVERMKDPTHSGPLITHDEITKLQDTVLDGSNPGALVGQRKEAVEAMAPRMLERLENAPDNKTFQRELAAIAGRYDAMAQIAPQNAEVMANEVLGKTITGRDGKPIYVQQMIEQIRSGVMPDGTKIDTQEWDNMRRDFKQQGISSAEAQARMEALRGAGGDPTKGPVAGPGQGQSY
jgi:hypothetical protein